jgi:thiamine biosynthesis lipoprotein
VTEPDRRAWVAQVMGMPISVHVRSPRVCGDVEGRVEEVFAELRRADALFSTYRRDSEISRLNRREIAVGDCDPLVREVIDLCEQAHDATSGYFDARMLGGAFDPSGVVKGWAVERASRFLADLPEHDYYLNAGGDIAVGSAPGGPGWRIGVEDPSDRSRLLGVFVVHDGGIATSGTAARGEHIVDPHTGLAAADLLSVTVIGTSLTWADVYATAAFARGDGALAWLNTLDGWQAVIVDGNGGVHSIGRER